MKNNRFRIKPTFVKLKESSNWEEDNSPQRVPAATQKTHLDEDLKELLQQVHSLIKQTLSAQTQEAEKTQKELEHRDRLITSVFKGTPGKDYDESTVEAWIGEVCRNVISTTFHYYIGDEMTFEQAKVFCCQQILRNISIFAEQHRVSSNFYVTLDLIMKEKVMPYLALKYPLSESLNVNKSLNRIVKEINNIQVINNDFFYNNPNIFLEYRQNGNYSDIIMQVLNQIISLADSPSSSGGSSNYKDFDNYITEMFEQVFDPVWATQKGWLMAEGRLPSAEGKRGSSFPGLMQELKGVEQLEKYRQKVQGYTHYEIGRKIPESVHIYSQDEIRSRHLQIKSPQILRIMSKWCEELWEKYQNQNYYIDRSEGVAMINSKQINSVYEWFRLALKQNLKEQKQKVIKFMGSVENNLYQQEFNILESELLSDEAPFLSRYERVCGKFSVKVVNNLNNCVAIYLNRLIHGLMSVSSNLFQTRMRGMPSWPSPPNLLSFKIGDLLRCRISSQQKEIIRLYDDLHHISDTNPEKLKIIRVKNRLKSGTNDLLINVRYDDRFSAEIQLKVKSKVKGSRFAEASYNFSHFIYEIQRSYFGPISQMCSIWNNLDPRNKIYRDLVSKENLKVRGTHQFCPQRGFEHDVEPVSNTPFICSSCGKFFSSDNYLLSHKKCSKCKYFSCAFCQIKERQSKDLIDDLDVEENIKQNLELERCKILPQHGISVKIENNSEGKVHLFTVVKILQKSHVFYLKNNEDFEHVYELKTQKHQAVFLKENIVYKFRQSVHDPLKKMTINMAVTDFIMPLYVSNCYRLEKQAISLNKISNITCQTQKLEKMLRDSKESKKAVKQLQISGQSLTSLDFIPEQMTNLEFINVNLNKITDLSPLVRFKKIKTIYCLSNNLGSFPAALCNLPLKILSITQNNISELPQEFEELQSLEVIRIASNSLRTFPQVITKLINIKEIYAENNQIKDISVTISNCNKLTLLNLQSNQVETLPQALEALSSLDILNLNKNNLISVNVQFKKLTKIRQLLFSSNKLKTIPGSLNECSSLIKLDLSSNLIQEASFENIVLEGIKDINLSKNEINQLSHLKSIKGIVTLNLSSNKLTKIPQEISELRSLQTLDLTTNQIKTLPEQISECVNLKKIILSFNRNIVFPSTFSKMKIQSMMIDRCDLTELDLSLMSLKRLKQLRISNNYIQKLPSEISGLKSLQIFQFQSNKISMFPQSMEELKNLKKISYRQRVECELEVIIKLSFNMPLSVLNLSASKIKKLPGEIPSNLFLESLNLSKNELETVPESISNLSNLKELVLESNKLEVLPLGIFSLPELEILKVNNNLLKELPNHFDKLKKLTTLNISSNKLTSIPDSLDNIYPSIFDFKYEKNQIPNILFWTAVKDTKSQKIVLSDMKLDKLPDFTYRNSYMQVFADRNELQEFPFSVLNLPHLTELYLQNNQIKDIPSRIKEARSLSRLNLSNNLIQKLPGEFRDLKSLTYLSIQNNPLEIIQEGFSQLTQFTLRISPQSFTAFHSNSCLQYLRPKVLELKGLNITEIPASMGEIASVTKLNLSENNLTQYPSAISRLINLTELNLSGQAIRALPDSLKDLQNLTTLIVNNCELTQLQENIGMLTKLTNLQFQSNSIEAIPESMSKLSALRQLHARNNKLKQLSKSICLANIKTMDLSHNQINVIPLQILNCLDCRVNLSNNAITKISQDINQRVKQGTINISANPLEEQKESLKVEQQK